MPFNPDTGGMSCLASLAAFYRPRRSGNDSRSAAMVEFLHKDATRCGLYPYMRLPLQPVPSPGLAGYPSLPAVGEDEERVFTLPVEALDFRCRKMRKTTSTSELGRYRLVTVFACSFVQLDS